MPIRDREVIDDVDRAIARVFDAAPARRANAVRQLFVEALDFHADSGKVGLPVERAGVELPAAAERVAMLEGVHVLHVALDAPANGRVRHADAAEAARLIARELDDELLLVFTNAGATQLHLIRPEFAAARPTLRRMVVERDLPQRTAVEQIASIYRGELAAGSVPKALDDAFKVEPVTKDFFAKYKQLFERMKEGVSGFGAGEAAERRMHMFVQTLFNRLMFVYFVQRKGWLDFRGEKDYLNALWTDYQSTRGDGGNFYRDKLAHLFFMGLSSEHDLHTQRKFPERDLQWLIGDVPFLNGGLFERGELDRRADVTVPDETIEAVLTDLFDAFNFTVTESTPLDIEVAVDPEMLGKVFEELVNDRDESGAYYTPRPVVSFMCREALKGHLEGNAGVDADAIRTLIDEREASGISLLGAHAVLDALDEITVVDPACGSGAYLLGMLQELIDLRVILYSDRLKIDAPSLYELKLEIISRNLYGADIDPFAVNIAMLRLWLSLAIDYEGERPEPLPNLDLTIVTGDSLLAAHATHATHATHEAEGGVQAAFGDEAAELGDLKERYLRTSAGPDKATLRARIGELNLRLREPFGGVGAADAGDGIVWRAAFAEVFEVRDGRAGGFDIVIANPPYRQLQSDRGRLANLHGKAGYRTFARTGDIYQLFYERGCALLRPEGGVLAYITSNSWLRAQYGRKLRAWFAERHTPLRWLDLGKDVFDTAIVDSGVLVLRTGGEAAPFPAVDMDRVGGAFPPPEPAWGRIGPDKDAPWSILSRVEQTVMDKMRDVGTPLAEWDVSINYGIKTGYNDAFIIDDATRAALIAEDPKSDEIIKPVLRGRDIRRWRAEWAGKWLIYSHVGVDEHAYPAVRSHLVAHEERLAKRRGGANPRTGQVPYEWWQLQVDYYNSGAYKDFGKPKLFWMDMSPEARFAYDDGEMFCNDKGFIMVGQSLKYLCAVLNSSPVTWLMQHTALTTGMGLLQWKRFAVERIPVPRIGEEEQRPFVELVDRILEAKAADAEADTSEWERAIDVLVYALYALTPAETAAVESALHRTPEGDGELVSG